MKKTLSIIALSAIGFGASAQTSSTATQTVNLSLSNAIEITFTGSGTATGAAVTLTFTTVNDYANGVESAAQQLKVRSNKNYKVDVKTNAANFTYSGSTTPAPSMPVSGVLGLKVSANGTSGTVTSPFSTSSYSTLSSTSANLLNNCVNGGNQLFSIMYQATPGFAYPAGTYTVDVVYTATQL
ncbi:MAG: hypothetical protein JST82_10775 [Bacteroidetes bacterium]|nr:hypothetical protein [Bacteroidota bacterium]